ncbi:hypothetical protein A2U01_0077181, partial [Trifolium medium]|nr:hypothetical protein [Trifolium medium]
ARIRERDGRIRRSVLEHEDFLQRQAEQHQDEEPVHVVQQEEPVHVMQLSCGLEDRLIRVF